MRCTPRDGRSCGREHDCDVMAHLQTPAFFEDAQMRLCKSILFRHCGKLCRCDQPKSTRGVDTLDHIFFGIVRSERSISKPTSDLCVAGMGEIIQGVPGICLHLSKRGVMRPDYCFYFGC